LTPRAAGFKTVWRHLHVQLCEARVKQVRVPLLARVALTLQFCITSDCVVCFAGSYVMHTQQTSHQRSQKRTTKAEIRTGCRCLLSRAVLYLARTRMDQTSPKMLTSLSGGGTSDKLDFLVSPGTPEAMMWANWGLPVFLWVEVIFNNSP
jgi:hypothetical protein